MQTAKQVSVSLVNKPGRLADVLAALSKGKVDLKALAVLNAGERGTVRFVPDDVDAAKVILDKIGVSYDLTDVLLVEITSQSGGFRHVCERLAAEHLNIDYAYCSLTGGRKGAALAVIKVNNSAKAQRVLSENGTGRKKLPFRRPVLAR
ncbi:MAG: hypothetical protein ABFC96_10115 [Thermoguttaceae bacterium]